MEKTRFIKRNNEDLRMFLEYLRAHCTKAVINTERVEINPSLLYIEIVAPEPDMFFIENSMAALS